MAQMDLEAIKRAIIAPRANLVKAGWVTLGLLVGTVLRYGIDRGTNGVPFLTFYPVVLLVAIFLDGWFAAIVALLAGVIVNYVFLPGPWLATELPVRIYMVVLYLLVISLMVVIGHVLRALVLENERHMAQAEAFNTELQHRTKNALQIMRSLIARGPRDEDPRGYYDKLAGRLDALAKANELLRFGVLDSCPMDDLIASTIVPFDRERFEIGGEKCLVDKVAATPLVMAIHELCTNATKYGALSAKDGKVLISWALHPDDRQHRIVLSWRETNGPVVTTPTRRGLGSRILTPNGGLQAVKLDWLPQGVACHMELSGRAVD